MLRGAPDVNVGSLPIDRLASNGGAHTWTHTNIGALSWFVNNDVVVDTQGGVRLFLDGSAETAELQGSTDHKFVADRAGLFTWMHSANGIDTADVYVGKESFGATRGYEMRLCPTQAALDFDSDVQILGVMPASDAASGALIMRTRQLNKGSLEKGTSLAMEQAAIQLAIENNLTNDTGSLLINNGVMTSQVDKNDKRVTCVLGSDPASGTEGFSLRVSPTIAAVGTDSDGGLSVENPALATSAPTVKLTSRAIDASTVTKSTEIEAVGGVLTSTVSNSAGDSIVQDMQNSTSVYTLTVSQASVLKGLIDLDAVNNDGEFSMNARGFYIRTGDSDVYMQGAGTARVHCNNDAVVLSCSGNISLQGSRTIVPGWFAIGTFTPANTADANGAVGDIAWDDNYMYVKTSAGWKRSALSTF